MIERLLEVALRGSPSALRALIEDETAVVEGSARRGDRSLVEAAEAQALARPQEVFATDAQGFSTLTTGGRTYAAGRFSTPSLAQLRRAAQASGRRGDGRLFVLEGTGPLTDIGALQAFSPPGTLFQVASQFNCLESPDACLVPVARYFKDPTQGPRAAVACFPAALLRHYAAPGPGGQRFTQQEEGPHLNLLEAACGEGVARVQCGYLVDQNVAEPAAFLRRLDERFEELRVGLQEDAEVVYGYHWDGGVPAGAAQRVHQVFTSTIAGGGYSEGTHGPAFFLEVARRLQRLAQLGTLLAAASAGARLAVLTLIGGGVFDNSRQMIFDAIVEAFDHLRTQGLALDVVINGRGLSEAVPMATLRARTEARGGCVVVVP